MTVGPDLTDDNGRLRPDVARAIQNVPDRPLPIGRDVEWPEAIGAPAPAVPAAPQPIAVPPAVVEMPAQAILRPAGQRFAHPVPNAAGAAPLEIRIPVPQVLATTVPAWMALTCAVAVAALALIAGARLGPGIGGHSTAFGGSTGTPPKGSVADSTPVESPARGAIVGINVNLRSGPGLGYAIVTKLTDGQPTTIRDERNGWVSITTSSGIAGWVYGAYLSGAPNSTFVPAVVRRLMIGGAGSSRVVLRPGDRVLHERGGDGRSIALLPDGRRMTVDEGGLVDVR